MDRTSNIGHRKSFLLKRVVLLFLLFVSSTSWAAEPSIQAYVDRDTVPVDETLSLQIEIEGGGALSSPDIPALGHFDVVGRSSGSSVEVVNGVMSLTKTFSYVLSPRNVGEYFIGPIKVHIEGKEYTAAPIRVKVVEGTKGDTYTPLPGSSSGPQGSFPNFPFPIPHRSDPNQPSVDQRGNVFLTADFDKKEAYVGEQVLFTFRLYSSVSIQDAQLTLPEFKDFISEELFKERKYEVELQGRRYAVNEWKFALFPTKVGKLETGESTVTGRVPVPMRFSPFDQDPFFGMRASSKPKTFKANSATVDVKELPPPPADFTGLIGAYTLESSLSSHQLNVGDTTYLKIDLKGKGNIQAANLPALKLQDSFKVYPSKPEVELKKNNEGVSGKKSFSFALVAEKAGEVTVSPLEMSYFNPQSKSYEKLSTSPFQASISGKKEEEKIVSTGIKAPAAAPKVVELPSVQKYYEKIIPILKSGIFWGILGVVVLAYLILLLIRKWQGKSPIRAAERKKSRAFRKAKKQLGGVSFNSEKEPFFKISQIFKDYLTDRYSIKGSVLTPMEVEEFLSRKDLPQVLIRRSTYFLEQLEQWKYGGAATSSALLSKAKDEAIELMQDIEKYS